MKILKNSYHKIKKTFSNNEYKVNGILVSLSILMLSIGLITNANLEFLLYSILGILGSPVMVKLLFGKRLFKNNTLVDNQVIFILSLLLGIVGVMTIGFIDPSNTFYKLIYSLGISTGLAGSIGMGISLASINNESLKNKDKKALIDNTKEALCMETPHDKEIEIEIEKELGLTKYFTKNKN